VKVLVRVVASLILGIAAIGLLALGSDSERRSPPPAPTAVPHTPPPTTSLPATSEPPATPCGPALRKPNGVPWQCTFADDFNGSVLDPGNWTALTTANSSLRGNGDCWVDDPNNISVANGVLRLTTRRMPQQFTCSTLNRTTFRAQITSGAVTTLERTAQTFGRWEIRARFPRVTTPGAHSAIWLYPLRHTYGPWPASGEIDIAEFVSNYPDRLIPYVHYVQSAKDPTVTNNHCLVAAPWDFHTLTTVWVPGRITIAIDGKVCLDHRIHPAKPLTGSQPFDRPYGLNLAQVLGVNLNSITAQTPLPLTMQVDYVRIWK
jgi:hypothetical protein